MLNLSYKAISANCVLKMDSNEINKFAKQFGLNKFLGVFAVDELSLIPKTRHGLVIFNTDTSQNVEGGEEDKRGEGSEGEDKKR